MSDATRRNREEGLLSLRQRILEAPLMPTMLRLSAPLMIGNLVSSLYWLIDALWLGLLGVKQLSIPTLAYYPFLIVYAFIAGLSMAAVSLVSQTLGRGNKDGVVEVVNRVLGASLAIAAVAGLAGFAAAPLFIELLGVSSDMASAATTYLRVQFLALPFATLMYTFRLISSSLGDTRTPSILLIVALLLNIILDPLLIFGIWVFPRLEVLGAAIASLASRLAISLVIAALMIRGFHGVRLAPRLMAPSRRVLAVMASVGLPVGLNSSIAHAAEYLLVGLVTRVDMLVGTVAALAAYTIGFRVLDVLRSIVDALSQGAAVVIGQSLGAGLEERAKAAANALTWLLLVVLSFSGLLFVCKGDGVARLFTNDSLAIQETWRYLSVLGLSLPLLTFFTTAWSIAIATGKTKVITYIAIARAVLIRLPLAYILALLAGMKSMGIWTAIAASNAAVGLLSMAWVARGRWAEAAALRRYEAG